MKKKSPEYTRPPATKQQANQTWAQHEHMHHAAGPSLGPLLHGATPSPACARCTWRSASSYPQLKTLILVGQASPPRIAIPGCLGTREPGPEERHRLDGREDHSTVHQVAGVAGWPHPGGGRHPAQSQTPGRSVSQTAGRPPAWYPRCGVLRTGKPAPCEGRRCNGNLLYHPLSREGG